MSGILRAFRDRWYGDNQPGKKSPPSGKVRLIFGSQVRFIPKMEGAYFPFFTRSFVTEYLSKPSRLFSNWWAGGNQKKQELPKIEERLQSPIVSEEIVGEKDVLKSIELKSQEQDEILQKIKNGGDCEPLKQYNDDLNFMLKAAELIGARAVSQASPRLRALQDFMLPAIKNGGVFAFASADESLRRDENFVIKAVKTLGLKEGPSVLYYIPSSSRELLSLEVLRLFGPSVLDAFDSSIKSEVFMQKANQVIKAWAEVQIPLEKLDDALSDSKQSADRQSDSMLQQYLTTAQVPILQGEKSIEERKEKFREYVGGGKFLGTEFKPAKDVFLNDPNFMLEMMALAATRSRMSENGVFDCSGENLLKDPDYLLKVAQQQPDVDVLFRLDQENPLLKDRVFLTRLVKSLPRRGPNVLLQYADPFVRKKVLTDLKIYQPPA